MNLQKDRTLQVAETALSPAEVLAAAKVFFSRRNRLYAAFLEKEGPAYLNFRGQGGEELIIAVDALERGTRVTGSTYLYDAQLARFYATLPPLGLAEVVA